MIDIKIELEEELGIIEGKLPENWNEITIGDYERVFENNVVDIDPLQQYLFIISALSKISKEVLLELPIDEFKNLIKKVEFINTPIPKEDCEYIEIGEDKYYLFLDYSQLTTGEVISIDTLLTQNNNNYNKIISDLLCIFLRKKKDNGRYEKFTTFLFDRKEDFKTLPITKVFHILTFFLNGKK